MKVAVVSTHPIQYHTPWFRELTAQNVQLKVYYALLPDQQQQSVGFGEAFAWDIPLLEGYDWELLPNKRKEPSLRGFFRSSTPAIYSRLTDTKPDALIITGWQALPLLQSLWAAFRLRIPCIVRGESNGLRPRSLVGRAFHRVLFSRFDAFLAIGKLNRQFYLEYGIPEERIFSTPYFVDNQRFVDQFLRDVRERDAVRYGWNIDGGRLQAGDSRPPTDDRRLEAVVNRPVPVVCFLFAGKLEPKKRVMDLLRAMDLASFAHGNIHLLVVGTGELMEEARQFAESRSLPVTFAGFMNQTEITRAYAAADCLVLPSDYGETWGLVVNEAMACGLPAIVSDRVGCGPDLVEEGITGSVFPCGDIYALASKLIDFATDREKMVHMGEQARQRIQDYSIDAAVEGTMRAIESVTRRDRRRATEDLPTTVDGRRTTGEIQATTNEGAIVAGRRSPFKVLHVIPSLSPQDGGPSFALPLIARGLERAGINVDVATTVGDDDSPHLNGSAASLPNDSLTDGSLAAVTRDGVNYFYFRRQSEFYKVSLPLSKWLAAHIREYDLVHIHALFSYSSYAAARIARKNRVPYIVRPLGVLNRWGMQNRRKVLKGLSFRFIEQRIVRDAAAIHYTSRQEKIEAEETGVRTEAVVIPLGVDLSGFRELPQPELFFEKFPAARDRDIILFLSRLDQKKGLDLLLRSFATDDGRRKTDGPRSSVGGPLLVIAGEGEEQFVAGLHRLAEELGIADKILWTGFLDGDLKLSALAAASLFVLPSYSENFGIALVEAMAAGLPCVLSDQVGIAEDAREYEAGLVVPCEADPLALAMRQLLDDAASRNRLGVNARRLVEERFSVEAMSNSLVELYDRVLARQPEDRRQTTEDRPSPVNGRPSTVSPSPVAPSPVAPSPAVRHPSSVTVHPMSRNE